jgi:hypothetical protein
VLFFYFVGVLVRQHYGIAVTIHNESGETLRRVSVKVESIRNRGEKRNLPDVRPGRRLSVNLQPVTESHITLRFVDARDRMHTETILGYAESGYCGKVEAVFLADASTKSNSNLECWKGWIDFIH